MNNKKHKKGFTLIELMVALVVITIISSVLLAGYNRFGTKITLQNITYKIALIIKEAQIYGSLGRNQNFGVFDPVPVGVKLMKNPSKVILFRDLNKNNSLDTGELIKSVKLIGDYSIDKILAKPENAASYEQVQELNILFKRPKTNANIVRGVTKYKEAEIYVSSPFKEKMKIFVNSIGLITVKVVR